MKKKCNHKYEVLMIVECKNCKKHWLTPLKAAPLTHDEWWPAPKGKK